MSKTGAHSRILLVCAANICRSPAAEVLMSAAWTASMARESIGLEFDSAGAVAMPGMLRCPVSAELVGREFAGNSRDIPVDILEEYGLILTMERVHRGPIVSANPGIRSRVFTLVEAAQLAAFIVGPGLVLDTAQGNVESPQEDFDFDAVPNLPLDLSQRWQWFLSELDAWRGQVPSNFQEDSLAVVDIPDPHDFREDVHAASFDRIEHATKVFIDALTEVMSR